jgi:hypothetical protein
MKKPKKLKYYHASTSVFKPGDIIAPNPYIEHLSGRGIHVTGSACAHYTLWRCGKRSIGEVRFNVYQVRPLNPKTKIIFGVWDELVIQGPVEVLRCLGEINKNKRVSLVKARIARWDGFRVAHKRVKKMEGLEGWLKLTNS